MLPAGHAAVCPAGNPSLLSAVPYFPFAAKHAAAVILATGPLGADQRPVSATAATPPSGTHENLVHQETQLDKLWPVTQHFR